ncbi:hypothetical protein ACI0X9_003296 [Cronobacter turicensis]
MKETITALKKISVSVRNINDLNYYFSAVGGKPPGELRPELLTFVYDAATFISSDDLSNEQYLPSPEYNVLLKQFNSLVSLNQSLNRQMSFLRGHAENYIQSKSTVQQLHAQIDSERAANARLTDEIYRLNEAIHERDRRLEAMQVQVKVTEGQSKSSASLKHCNSPGSEDAKLAFSLSSEHRIKQGHDHTAFHQLLQVGYVRFTALEQYQMASQMVSEHCDRIRARKEGSGE